MAFKFVFGGVVVLAMLSAASCAGDEESGNGDGDDTPDGDGDDLSSGDGDGDDIPGGDGDGSIPGGDGDGDGAVPVEALPSEGCDGAADPPSGPLTLNVGDDERSYIVSLPDGYDPSAPYPVIFAFHGLGGSGAGVSGQWYFGIEQKGGTPTIFVYPDGLETDQGGAGWPNQGGRDVAFFDAMLSSLTAGYCIDENRVFSTGHSYGGIMTYTLACERADVLRAVAPVAGSRWARSACQGPVAAWGAHGDPDDQVSYESGVEAMARIIEENGCDADSAAPIPGEEPCVAYSCDPGRQVVWCQHDQGHDWPDFAAQSIKSFFDAF